MKKHSPSIQILAFTGVILSCISPSLGVPFRGVFEDRNWSGIETLPAIQSAEEEAALLRELQGYRQQRGNPDNDARISGIVQALTDYGSTNAIQFFLDNIEWRYRSQDRVALVASSHNVIKIDEDYPMVIALLKIKDVPLRQCADAYMKKSEGHMKTSGGYIAIEYVARQIHGDDFLQEIELRDPEQGEGMRMRWYEPEKWLSNWRLRNGWRANPREYPPPPRPTNSVEIIILDEPPEGKRITINGFTFVCSAKYAALAIQRELEYIQASYERHIADKQTIIQIEDVGLPETPGTGSASVSGDDPTPNPHPSDESPPDTVSEVQQSNLWLYVGAIALLCVGMVFVFIRKKKSV